MTVRFSAFVPRVGAVVLAQATVLVPQPPACQQFGNPVVELIVSSDGFCSAFTPAAAGAGGLTYTPGLNVPPMTCCTVFTVVPTELWPFSQVTN